MGSPLRIVTTRIPIGFALAAAAIAAACAAAPASIELRGSAEINDQPAVAIRVLLRPDHRAYGDRFLAGAIQTIRTIDRTFGRFGLRDVVLVDQDWRGDEDVPRGAVLMPAVRWWTTPTVMAPELSAARAVSSQFWNGVLRSGRLPGWFRDSLAELMARRVSMALFASDNLTPGYGFSEARYFGGFVPRFVRIRALVETDGAANDAYRARPGVDMAAEPQSDADRAAQIGKAILTFTTLERWLGEPTADDIVQRFVGELRDRALTLADFEQLASDVSGQDLSWLFDSAFRSTGQFDYRIDRLASAREGEAYATTVTVRRDGDAQFTGSSARRDGDFERGRGVAVQVTFADGQQRIDYWDGRDRTRTFRYRGPSPVRSAIVDPQDLMLLDARRTHNSAAAEPATASASSLWAVRYALWVESLLLTWAGLV